MKAVIILFFLVFIGFGYLLSDNLNTQQELAEVSGERNRVEAENQHLREQNASLSQTIDTLTLERNQAFAEKSSLESTLQAVIDDRSRLEQQLATIAQENDNLKEQVRGLVKINGELAAQNAALLSTVQQSMLVKSEPAFVGVPVTGDPATKQRLALSILGLLVSSAAVYLVSHVLRNRSPGNVGKARRRLRVELTEKELEQLVHSRRNR